jgi:hypothetical protein
LGWRNSCTPEQHHSVSRFLGEGVGLPGIIWERNENFNAQLKTLKIFEIRAGDKFEQLQEKREFEGELVRY